MPRPRTSLSTPLLALLAAAPLFAAACTAPAHAPAHGPADARMEAALGSPRAADWRTDPAWYDGQAELCVYDATRTIYGAERRYTATAYTNKQRMDPRTTTKAEGGEGVEVFKHHWSERVPTERYDYDFSTAVFLRTDDLAPFKLTAATQEDCGASFKQLWRDGDRLRWSDSVYFPGAGMREGRVRGEPGLVDGLALALRDFPFDAPRELELELLPSQKSTRQVAWEPVRRTVRHAGRATLEVPAGAIEAHLLELVDPTGAVEARFAFAADGSAPWLHALVSYEGPGGVTYHLRSLERDAYWER